MTDTDTAPERIWVHHHHPSHNAYDFEGWWHIDEVANGGIPYIPESITDTLTRERDEALNQLDSALYSVEVLEKRVAEARAEVERLREALEWAYRGNGLDQCALTVQSYMSPFEAQKKPVHAIQVGLRQVIDKIRDRAALKEGE